MHNCIKYIYYTLKYATQADLLRLHRVFDHIPVSVGNRIKYARTDPHEQARDLRKALDLLAKAQVIMKAYHTDASGIPVLASADQRKFKTFFMDCGLMNSMCGIQRISPGERILLPSILHFQEKVTKDLPWHTGFVKGELQMLRLILFFR